jgi:hypothetical protein
VGLLNHQGTFGKGIGRGKGRGNPRLDLGKVMDLHFLNPSNKVS